MMDTAERLNYDEFDMLCCAADSPAPLSLDAWSESLQGENRPPRGKIALHRLLRRGYVELAVEGKYRISSLGTRALS